MGFGWNTSPVLLMLIMPAVWGLKNVPPEQVHLSYTGNSTEMVVTWVTQDTTSTSTVMYGLSDLNLTASGSMTTFVDGGSQHRKLYIHRVTLTGLLPGHKYVYVVGGPEGWSKQFNFRAMKDGSDWSPKMMVYGDMGSRNDRALPYLQHNAHTGHFDAVLHVGDFAYDMHDNNARVGDDFMRQIEPIAAYVPYMTCVGNHEYAYNFANYRNRFTMPGGDGTGMYFSWNIGPAHIISFNTEVYYYQYATTHNIKRQYDWLEADLKEANQPANRAARPWIITMGHRPMYCSNDDDDEMCRNPANPIRNGIAAFWPNLEDLFYKYGVDVEFYAHEHSYERLLPVYKGKVCGGAVPYTNPRSPVHIITGSAGDKEGQEKFLHHPAAWSAFRSDDYGFTVMDIVNSTHLTLQQVSSDKNGHVIDSIVLIKDKHGAGLYNCV
ncbi:LOW QUALITY PROTEIN: acid phosphatase type 7-like [Pomacea canaliculata]|uniref:LOW QUALITY PROTEIN: acid phosphatase type 7-like n=1 Tax=Pomacea canaliculata TaxID=400727 RepID=UPI000D725497|nr:LOW QUALITY PROTEIN: acid phosphatase type 7-like [Pomacea canaliculata]